MKSQQSGFTLIEVLIAVLVLSFGVLGMGMLQLTGLRMNHGASLRTQATLLAYDMTDRMRVNREGYEDGYYNDPNPADHNCVWDGGTLASCTRQKMAEHDRLEWDASIARALPQGVGVVCLDNTPEDGGDADSDGIVESAETACDNAGSLYAIKLWWQDEYDQSGNRVIKRFVTVFQP